MTKQLLSTGYKTQTYYHQDDGKFHIQTVSDVTNTVEHAKYLHNTNRLTNPAGDHHLARLPIVVVNAWAQARGLTFDQVMGDNRLMHELLNDPANSEFRVHKGKV